MNAGVNTDWLAQPIVDLLAGFGTGLSAGAGELLRQSSTVVEDVHSAGRGGINGMYPAWRGAGGDAALDKALRVQTTAATAAERGQAMAEVVDRAGAEVAAGQREVQEILRSFLETVEGVGPAGFTPAALALLIGSAIDHYGRALKVVERVRAELETDAAAMRELSAPPPVPAPATPGLSTSGEAVVPASVVPASVVPAAVGSASGGQQLGSTLLSSGSSALESGSTMVSGLSTVPASLGNSSPRTTGRTRQTTGETRPAGTGVRLTLPDGSTVEAPNQQAADAVRYALSAVGTPYVWGGTTPSAGLDCSGLTQWAYAEAGVPLPRLAQEQGNGHTRIDPGDVMPGDLAVWDGHVAMVIGNGQLVEAGDPVQVGPIRTENSGMSFLGFYRPTS